MIIVYQTMLSKIIEAIRKEGPPIEEIQLDDSEWALLVACVYNGKPQRLELTYMGLEYCRVCGVKIRRVGKGTP